ncbi:MAG: site-specific DNA-methyltransferase [Lentisphaeria bacterium]|jgi:adenine-specific DNA-methyltransferase
MAVNNLEKFKALLAELLMLDQADLDFGIYRIMNAKRGEISKFLSDDLLPLVRRTLDESRNLERLQAQAEITKAEAAAESAGFSPDASPKVLELRERHGRLLDVATLEQEVFSCLYDFFRRYYNDGDFLALRRYKPGVYAVPYEGEEVYLHWANKDQYYIKSGEYFRDYCFKLADGRRVHFRIAAADTEKDNTKAEAGKERRFILAANQTFTPAAQAQELELFFEYRPDAEGRKQAALNSAAIAAIQAGLGAKLEWLAELERKWRRADGSASEQSVLQHHLDDYTARNSFDYFIHKDLGGFLRRELDFYLKNEVMHLDDIEQEGIQKVEQALTKLKAIRRIAHKIIDFLAQLEEFQKKLWLKKKFVVETNWCLTLDRVPESLYAEIAANHKQYEEWEKLGFITTEDTEDTKEEAVLDLFGAGNEDTPKYQQGKFSCLSCISWLKKNPYLVLDTKFFPAAFTEKLLASIDNLDDQTDGLLIHSENFQALNLLQERYREQIKCITIDPPYNRLGDSFPYKDNYQHSSWLTMMHDRMTSVVPFLRADGALFSNIDENERDNLQAVLGLAFGSSNRVEELIWAQNTTHSQSPLYSTNHEYIEVYARNRAVAEREPTMFREPKPGYAEVMALVAELNPNYPPLAEIEQAIAELFKRHIEEYRLELREQGLLYDEETKKQDPWRGLYAYNNPEYRDDDNAIIPESEAKKRGARLCLYQPDNASAPAQKQANSTRDPNDPNFRFYEPCHPTTGKLCIHPKTGWRWPLSWHDNSRDSFEALNRAGRIAWGVDETTLPRFKRFLHEVETNVSKSVFHDYTDGEKQIAALFGETGVFPTPKPTTLPGRFISQTCGKTAVALDYFAGSGTTGHAVINLNREDKGKRKYILIEMGEHFATVLTPRIQKVVYAKDWKDGKPVARDTGISHCFKYLRLESYEDTLNNLEARRTAAQTSLLTAHPAVREDYTLRYLLDTETRESASLLNLDRFRNPFAYTLKIATGSAGETRETAVDLVETFNYLIGLRVRNLDRIRGIRVVTGTLPTGDKALLLWRNLAEVDNAALEEFFKKQGYSTRDLEFAVIYVNGDNTLENLRRPDQTWKVRLIEQEFTRLMFAGTEAGG